jgi:hypothetical protein
MLRSTICLAAAAAPSTTALAQRDTAGKSAVAAGALSYLFPGAGSLYAGDQRHALVHAAVGAASLAAFLLPLTDKACREGPGPCPVPLQAIAISGFFAYGTNSILSIVTAVRDANAHNAALASSRRARDSVSGTAGVEPPRTAFGFHGMHLGVGFGSAPYLNQWTGAQTAEVRLGVSPFRDWTLAYSHSEVVNEKGTDYFVRDCNGGRGCYPNVGVRADAFELQRRWHREHRVHPIAAASVGSLVSKYAYYRGSGIAFEPAVWDSTQYRQFASVSGGLEADIWGWIHAMAYGGYRQSTTGTVPNGKSSNSGPTLAWLVEIGKF